MRKDLDEWSFEKEGEDHERALRSFLIGFEELRVRLAPLRYPNVEISDEGYLWFNIDTPAGIVEVLAFPFGFEGNNTPAIAVSLPRKAEEADNAFLNRLSRIAHEIGEVQVFANVSETGTSEILSAFKENKHPPLIFTSDPSRIRTVRKGVFLAYFGLLFPVVSKTVSEAEHAIREILLRLE